MNDLDALPGRFTGELIRPGDDDYDAARRVWNAMVDHRPALIARCTTSRDVAAAIEYGRAADSRSAFAVAATASWALRCRTADWPSTSR